MALKFHPDKNKSSNAHDLFIQINEAYLLLYDDEARAKYDFEYNRYYQKKQYREPGVTSSKETDFKSEQSGYSEPSNKTKSDHAFDDDVLNDWSTKAKEQAEKYAKMAFSEFSSLVLGIVKETGFQISNVLIGIFGGLLFILGLNEIFVLLYTSFEKGSLIAIILGILGFYLIRYAYQRENKNRM